MLIESNKKYVGSLVRLWQEVFGDEEDYIRFFFKEAYSDSECFAEIVGGEIVSALYLLKCCIKYAGKIYYGRYLYAAATLPTHRGKGLMSKLIDEALNYAKHEDLDFIALLPASDSLYGYYERFGFVESMYKYKLTVEKDISTLRAFREITDPDEFHKIRSSADTDMLIYNDVISRYAFDCLSFADNKIYSIDDESYYIEGEEFFSVSSDFRNAADNLISNLVGESVIYSNRALESAKKVRNGMIHSLNCEFRPKDIYMNIALD